MDAIFPTTLADAEKLTDAELAELLNIMAVACVTWGRHNVLMEAIRRLTRCNQCKCCIVGVLEK